LHFTNHNTTMTSTNSASAALSDAPGALVIARPPPRCALTLFAAEELKDMAFECTLMDDPVVAADGHTYNRVDIENWLKEHDTSPLTHEPLESKALFPNMAIRRLINAWREEHGFPALVLHKPPAAAAAAAAAGPEAHPLIQKPIATCATHPREQLRVFCCDCDHAVCLLCAVDSKKCKAHTTEAFDTLLDELKADWQGWAGAQQECNRSAQQLCAAIQADGDAKKQAIDTQVAELQQQVRSAAAARSAALGAVVEKWQEREERVAGAAASSEVGRKGSPAAAVVSCAIRRAKAPVPPASAAEFVAAAAPDAAVGRVTTTPAALDPDDEAARAAAEAARRRTVQVNRTVSYSAGGTWGFGCGGCDALTISVSAPVAVSGVSLCPWQSGSTSGDVDIYVIEGSSTSGRVLAHRLLRDVQLNTGGIVPLMLEQPVQLAAAADYTLVLRMQGGMAHQHCPNASTSISSTTSAGAPFTVTVKNATINGPSPNLNSDNGTSSGYGQIPSIFFSC
jgi:hypothetical protein